MTRVAGRAAECDQAVRATVAAFRRGCIDHGEPQPDPDIATDVAPDVDPDAGLDVAFGAARMVPMADRRAAVEAARADAGRELPRFERYVVASVLVVDLPALVDWVVVSISTMTTTPGGLRWALVLAGLVFFGTAYRVQTVDLGGAGVLGWLRGVHALARLAYVWVHLRAGLLRDLAPDDVPWLGAGSVLPLTMLALGVRWPARRTLPVLAAGLLVVGAALAGAGLRPAGLAWSLLAVAGFSGFLVMLPRFSWWMLEVAWSLHREREAAPNWRSPGSGSGSPRTCTTTTAGRWRRWRWRSRLGLGRSWPGARILRRARRSTRLSASPPRRSAPPAVLPSGERGWTWPPRWPPRRSCWVPWAPGWTSSASPRGWLASTTRRPARWPGWFARPRPTSPDTAGPGTCAWP